MKLANGYIPKNPRVKNVICLIVVEIDERDGTTDNSIVFLTTSGISVFRTWVSTLTGKDCNFDSVSERIGSTLSPDDWANMANPTAMAETIAGMIGVKIIRTTQIY